MWGGSVSCQAIIAQGFICSGSLLEVPSLRCFTALYHSINSSGTCHVRDSASGSFGLSLRDEEVPKSEYVCVWSQKGAPTGSLESPTEKGPWS